MKNDVFCKVGNQLFPRFAPLLAALFGPLAACANPVIFNASETVQPGDVVAIQGGNFSTAPTVQLTPVSNSGSLGTPVTIPRVNGDSTVATAQVPASTSFGLYQVAVIDSSGNASTPVLVNAARVITVEYPEVTPGYSFRLFGRNLVVTGGTPAVSFQDVADSSSTFTGTVESGGNSYIVTVQAPDGLVPGHTYTILYENGLGGPVGQSAAPATLGVRATVANPDPFSLNLPWGDDFGGFSSNVYNVKTDTRLSLHAAGDGTTDDGPALQAAINIANTAGGGVVYLPSGTYCIKTFGGTGGGVGLTLKSNVVLSGDGAEDSTIAFDAPTNVDTTTSMIATAAGSSVMGFLDIGVTCTSESSSEYDKDYPLFSTNTDTKELFFLNTLWDGGEWTNGGLRLTTSTGGRFLLASSTVQNICRSGRVFYTKDYGGAPVGSQYIYIRNNTFPNSDVGPQAGAANLIYEGNTLTFDGNYWNDLVSLQPTQSDNGIQNRLNVSGPSEVVYNNTFSQVGDFVNQNDGEDILSEDDCQNSVSSILGTATSATATTLTDSTQNWTNNYTGWNVVIVDGTGAGETATIESNTGTQVTLTAPWMLAPDTTSKYAIVKLMIPHLFIDGNTMTSKAHVLQLGGGDDLTVVNNTATNSGDLEMNSRIEYLSKVCHPMIKAYVAGNTISNSVTPSYPGETSPVWAYPGEIMLNASYFPVTSPFNPVAETRWGTGVFLAEFRHNNVTSGWLDGFRAVNTLPLGPYPLIWHPQGSAQPYAIQGAIYDGNTVNSTPTAYGWVPGVDGFVVMNYTNSNVLRTTYDVDHEDGMITAGSVTSSALVNGAAALGGINVPTVFTLEGQFLSSATSFGTLDETTATGAGGDKAYLASNGHLALWDMAWTGGSTQSTGTLNDGNWHHFAWTYDGTTNQLYIDGALQTTVSRSRSFSASGGAQLGAGPYVPYAGAGQLKQVRLWNVVRSGTQIANWRSLSLAGDEPGLINYWRLDAPSTMAAYNNILSADLANGLVAYWNYDDDSGTSVSDVSGNGNNGPISGTPDWVPGFFGYALLFDGATNYVTVPANTSWQGTSGLTVHARVNVASINNAWNYNFRYIASTCDPSNPNNGWALYTEASALTPTQVHFAFVRGTVGGSGTVVATGATTISTGQYYDVTATFDPTSGLTSLYVNGQPDGSVSNSRALLTSTTPLVMGRNPTAPTNTAHYFNGDIDDVKVWNRALSAQEASELDLP